MQGYIPFDGLCGLGYGGYSLLRWSSYLVLASVASVWKSLDSFNITGASQLRVYWFDSSFTCHFFSYFKNGWLSGLLDIGIFILYLINFHLNMAR